MDVIALGALVRQLSEWERYGVVTDEARGIMQDAINRLAQLDALMVRIEQLAQIHACSDEQCEICDETLRDLLALRGDTPTETP